MHRSATDPLFALRELRLPGSPLLCFLVANTGTVTAWVNIEYEPLSHDHAAYHARGPLDGGHHHCVVDVDCGYDPEWHGERVTETALGGDGVYGGHGDGRT